METGSSLLCLEESTTGPYPEPHESIPQLYTVVVHSLYPKDGGSKVLRNVGILPHDYTVSQKTTASIFITVKTSHILFKILSILSSYLRLGLPDSVFKCVH
jgi:hypothetical protein